MPSAAKEIIDGALYREQVLHLARRLEATHLSLVRGVMRDFRAGVSPVVLAESAKKCGRLTFHKTQRVRMP